MNAELTALDFNKKEKIRGKNILAIIIIDSANLIIFQHEQQTK